MHIETKDLPPSVQAALAAVGYGKRDIGVEATERCSLSSLSGAGMRAFAAVCRLDGSTAHEIQWGSWGGSNAFQRSIDDLADSVALTPDLACVIGHVGGAKPAYAVVYVHPSAVIKALPAPSEVTEKERQILAIFGGYKSFARPEYLQRLEATAAEIDSLVSRGYLSRNKTGATQITTKGKNARGSTRVW